MDSQNQNNTLIFKDCGAVELSGFISALEQSPVYKRKSYQPISEKVHFERFNYLSGANKISIVYDTKAKMLTVTAKTDVLATLKEMYGERKNVLKAEAINKADANNEVNLSSVDLKTKPKNANSQKNKLPSKEQKPPQKPNNSKAQFIDKTSDNEQEDNFKFKFIPAKKASAAKEKLPQKSNAKKANVKQSKTQPQNGENEVSLEYKDGFALKNYAQEVFNATLEQVKSLKGISVKAESDTAIGVGAKVKTFKITDKSNAKLYLRYMPEKKIVQLQGKECQLFKDVQMLLYKGTDFKTAISSYIKQTGEDESASALEKKLKRLLPNAYEFLSNQAKQYLTIAFMDINNEDTRLSDYSALMVSPYRGLERLIYDLQIAQGIEVKMIGQAYEKDERNKYCLKSGYRKKIQSVIYNEVMSDLYTEYFEKRNFYLHSDNSTNSELRVIRDKKDAKAIFDNLLTIIDYNCKKLKEIGFRI